MDRKKKVLSPHFQIYRLPLVSLMSITHRISGIILAVFFIVSVYLLSFFILSPVDIASMLFNFSSFKILFYLGVFLSLLCLYFHFLNGFRHLLWDVGIGFSMPVIRVSNVVILINSVVFSMLTFCIWLW